MFFGFYAFKHQKIQITHRLLLSLPKLEKLIGVTRSMSLLKGEIKLNKMDGADVW